MQIGQEDVMHFILRYCILSTNVYKRKTLNILYVYSITTNRQESPPAELWLELPFRHFSYLFRRRPDRSRQQPLQHPSRE